MFRNLKRSDIIYFMVPLVCLLAYIGILKTGHRELDLHPHINYFRDLAGAFLQGKLDIVKPHFYWDLVTYNQKYYLYWPPVPAAVYMPLVALFGMNLPDGLICSIFGMTNVLLIMLISGKLIERFNLKLTPAYIFWIGIFWGLGTVHYYMSKDGSVWFISQIMAQTFLLASVYFFLKAKGSLGSFVLPGVFFALAVYTRNHLVFSIFFFVLLYLALHRTVTFKEFIFKGFVFLIPFILFSILNGWYNYARFGNVLENGIKYHKMDKYFMENYKLHGYFSLYYFPHNFFIEVIHPPTLMLKPPYIKKESEGFGFIWGSALFFLLIPAFFLTLKNNLQKKPADTSVRLIRNACLAAALPIACVIFSIMGTGWVQFCARYTLDFQFFLLIYLIFSWKELQIIPYLKPLSISLIIISMGIQYIGASGG